jgi:hypothetical protein
MAAQDPSLGLASATPAVTPAIDVERATSANIVPSNVRFLMMGLPSIDGSRAGKAQVEIRSAKYGSERVVFLPEEL